MTAHEAGSPRLHVAIIPDGNGRWAERRGRPRFEGHVAGTAAVRRLIDAAARDRSIGTLTLFAFSTANWTRPSRETRALMEIFEAFLDAESLRWTKARVRVVVIGRRDRIPPSLKEAIERAEAATAGGDRLRLRLAIDYGARDAVVEVIRRFASGEARRPRNGHSPETGHRPSAEQIARLLARANHDPDPPPDVDLLIRTGGERRLSDCLLWEAPFAELHFTRRLWPDFRPRDLRRALIAFGARSRRFGALEDPPRGAGTGSGGRRRSPAAGDPAEIEPAARGVAAERPGA